MNVSYVMILSTIWLLLFALPVWGSPTVSITGQAPLYEVSGEGLQGIGAIDISVSYEGSGLVNPHVTKSSLLASSMMMPHLSVPGLVRVIILSQNSQGISGNGSLLQIGFDTAGAAAGRITTVSAKMVSAVSRAEISDVVVRNLTNDTVEQSVIQQPSPTPVTSQPPPAAETSQSTTTPGTTHAAGEEPAAPKSSPTLSSGSMTATSLRVVEPGTGSLADVDRKREVPGVAEAAPVKEPAREIEVPPPVTPDAPDDGPLALVDIPQVVPAAALPEKNQAGENSTSVKVVKRNEGGDAAQAPASDESTSSTGTGVLGLFRDYRGERSPQKLAALFTTGSVPGVSQNPPIAVSDGVTPVILTVDHASSFSPNFSVTGGSMTSLKKDGKRYLLTIVPEAGVVEVSVSLLSRGKVTEIPLTVVPPLNLTSLPTGKLDDTSYAYLLKGTGGGTGDINRDGVRNYLDDYILTGHYLRLKNRK